MSTKIGNNSISEPLVILLHEFSLLAEGEMISAAIPSCNEPSQVRLTMSEA